MRRWIPRYRTSKKPAAIQDDLSRLGSLRAWPLAPSTPTVQPVPIKDRVERALRMSELLTSELRSLSLTLMIHNSEPAKPIEGWATIEPVTIP